MRVLTGFGIFCLLVFCGCSVQKSEDECPDEPRECKLADEGQFLLRSLDLEFIGMESCKDLDATLIEMPFTGNSGNFVLCDAQGKAYRFEPLYELDWEEQLDGLQLGRTYHFVFARMRATSDWIDGMRILDDGGKLLYLAELHLYFYGADPFISCIPEIYVYLERGEMAFGGTELQGFIVEQRGNAESPCCGKKETDGYGCTILVTSIPMFFQYGDQTTMLYQSQEAVFTTPHGDYLIHARR